jgi:RNA:NAD 2'-phosphotransferase (TPT1/KptA family)|nr:hypothetical protein [uncultured Dongia sp.]
MMVQEYPFPEQTALEGAGYCVFPPQLENDELVLFHGTSAENSDAILRDGFKSAVTLGTGNLTSVSFTYKSMAALTHLANRNGARVILAVRYETLDRRTITKNSSDIHDYTLDPAPIVIGICHLPLDYRHT